MRYIILTHTCSNGLSERINEYLKNGWKLHGPTFYAGEIEKFCQAMVM